MSHPELFLRTKVGREHLTPNPAGLEIWGGVECTVNRVGNTYYDQFRTSGHKGRPEDLDAIAELGIRTLRYPILWEHHSGASVDWSWADERMEQLRKLKIEPIIGLVHHGSGPPHTNLLDANFARGLAEHAEAVARRYPWIKYYNPVNEPVTTARFSGLYGHWYPHGRDARTFHRALIVQCQAVREAMRAIRVHNPRAMLIQTEDMGRTYSTAALRYQADFDNSRRWLSLDLLCGRMSPEHPLWGFLVDNGVQQEELESFLVEPCPPDIIGINYYLTSERFLDEELENYPVRCHGGNGRERYADVSAVRVSAPGIAGPYGILQEAWKRYGLPLAVTEAHLGCTRDEQLRWLMEVWNAAARLREKGCDLRAVTAWSLLGAYDWNTLLTRAEGYYEPGAFDLRSPRPRRTVVAQCIRSLAASGAFHHPVLHQEGWWRRPTRLLYRPMQPAETPRLDWVHKSPCCSRKAAPLLITGGMGTLGQAFRRLCDLRGLLYQLVSRQEMDIAYSQGVDAVLERVKPWAVINTAGYVRVDDAEQEAETCFRENTAGPVVLAKACAARDIPLVTFSSDLVFNGAQQRPYLESDAVSPLNVYGRSKAEAERQILQIGARALVIRTSAFFGPWDDFNFVTLVRKKLTAGQTVSAVSDAFVSPTYVPDLVHAALDLLIDGEIGLWHLANQGALSWAELAAAVAQMAELPRNLIVPIELERAGYAAARPRYSVLSSNRGLVMPAFQDALARYCEECSEISSSEVPSLAPSGCSNRSQSESSERARASEDVSLPSEASATQVEKRNRLLRPS